MDSLLESLKKGDGLQDKRASRRERRLKRNYSRRDPSTLEGVQSLIDEL